MDESTWSNNERSGEVGQVAGCFVQNKSSCNGIRKACMSSVSPTALLFLLSFCFSVHTDALTFVSETAKKIT
jgi:hypothetical protein